MEEAIATIVKALRSQEIAGPVTVEITSTGRCIYHNGSHTERFSVMGFAKLVREFLNEN